MICRDILRRARVWACLICCYALALPDAQSALIMEDHFLSGATLANGEYANTVVLPAQNPTITNANGAWGVSGSVSSGVNARSTSTGLTLGTFPTSGGAIEIFRTGNNSSADSASFFRPASNNSATTLLASEEFYFSAVVQYTGAHRIGLGLEFEGLDNFGIGFDKTGNIGITRSVTNDGNANALLNAVNNAGNPFAAGTYLIVGKVTPNPTLLGTETISVLLVTNDGNSIPGLEPAALTSNSTLNVWEPTGAGDSVENYWLFAQKPSNNAGGTVYSGRFDEFRVGRSYVDVVAIPEPSSLALFGLACASFLGYSCRNRFRD